MHHETVAKICNYRDKKLKDDAYGQSCFSTEYEISDKLLSSDIRDTEITSLKVLLAQTVREKQDLVKKYDIKLNSMQKKYNKLINVVTQAHAIITKLQVLLT